MSRVRPLRGGCSCGRNTYVVEVPPDATEVAQVFFDRSAVHRWSSASPLSAWLRVPLSWYHSTTYAFFDDETHTAIKRMWTSPREGHAKRGFCGFCGTPLSYWSECPQGEGEWISLTLGSLQEEDLRDLDLLGLLEGLEEDGAQQEGEKEGQMGETRVIGRDGGNGNGSEILPWLESLLQGSRLGRVRRSRGKRQTGDGRVRMEWEIVELLPDEEVQGTGKRKIGDIENPHAVMDERQ